MAKATLFSRLLSQEDLEPNLVENEVIGNVKNEEDNRFKSSITSAYESSPFSYANKGEDLEIKKSQYFYLKFPNIPYRVYLLKKNMLFLSKLKHQ